MFRENKTNPWKTQTYSSDNDQFSDWKTLRFGGHPFKIKEISNDAPILTFNEPTINPYYLNNFNLNVNITQGFVYDLNRYFPNIKIPMYVSQRRDKSFVFVQGSTKLDLPDSYLDNMRIPVDLFNPYSLFIKTVGGVTDVDQGSGMLFFECVFRDLTTIVGNGSAYIRSASILTDVQLKKKYPGTIIDRFGAELPQRYRNTVRTFIFYSPERCFYRCINSARFSFTKGLPLPSPDTYSEDFKKKLALENSGSGGPFTFIFETRPSSYPVLKHDLFLRIN